VTDAGPFALVVLLAAAVGLVVVLSNRLTERVKIPSPALVLAGAAVAVKVVRRCTSRRTCWLSGW
jgi:potassium/hydrogen antiporter